MVARLFELEYNLRPMKICALALLLACARPAPQAVAVKEVEEPAVAGCKKLGRLVGTSALPGEAGMDQARKQASAKAAAAGATHLVVADEWQSPDAASAAVKAYECDVGSKP
jgi:hypothetical protein